MRRYVATVPFLALAFGTLSYAQLDVTFAPSQLNRTINCDEAGKGFCLDRSTRVNYEGKYVGHDEPSVIFYSRTPGSGNQTIYNLILPKEPPIAPKQDGSGGTFNFQLHVTFWFGMALCDTQSAPVPNKAGNCIPDSDTNIANSTNLNAPDYIGKHSGTAFLELQFYPPGWIGSPQLVSSNAYFAALNVDSFSFNMLKNQNNNLSCLQQVGQEPVNFAVLTRNGVPLTPANPLGAPIGTSVPNVNNVLLMSPGDSLRVTIQDSPGGVLTQVQDLTTGQTGFMIAGPASGFAQVDFNPSATACTVTPYAFHPMYSTSSEDTRVPWATHSYNVAFSDEIGHFEFCNGFNTNPNSPHFLDCTVAGFPEFVLDSDDAPCANPAFFGLPSSFQQITGCIGEDLDFDGPSYGLNWPGTGSLSHDTARQPTPIMFTSPQFMGPDGMTNYDRMAFETDMPSFEAGCDVGSGNGCQNPPAGAAFYPIYSTTIDSLHQCWWQVGGPDIPGTVDSFGGTSTAEYGGLLTLAYPTPFGAVFEKGDFNQTIANPCLEPPFRQ
jgi:hypothetical protein